MRPSSASSASPGPASAGPRFALRPYQRDAIAAVVQARRDGVRRMVVCLPTGAGKTVIFSELARLARRPVLVLAHRRELVQQARDKLARALQDDGVVAIEQGDDSAHDEARVVVASIRSLHQDRLARLLAARDFGLVVYDECHHATADDNQRVLRTLGAFGDDWSGTLLGFTATTARGDGQGLDQVFERIVYTRTIHQMVDDGFLAPLRGYRIATAADLTHVGLTRSDLVLEELAEAVDVQERNALVARAIQELARDRRTIAFCVTVAHARNLARALNAVGVPCGIVYGAMPADRRQQTLDDFRAGRLAAVTNVGVLTEGFDDPSVSCIAMARPTRSEGLYAQCVGRGTRLAPGKTDCLVLDFVDLSDLSLMGLPALAGLPRDLDLEGGRVDDAERTLARLFDQHPGLEVDPGTITLGEIQRRARDFDPLALGLDPEVLAISPNRWESLGARGLVLHAYWGPKAARRDLLSEILVLDGGGRGRRWQVQVDGKEMARFSHVQQAVEAVDHEVGQRGPDSARSATERAAWRREPVPEPLRQELVSLGASGSVADRGQAMRLLSFLRHARRGRVGRRAARPALR
ncbi:MAG: DEAD/DEAH box helicase [Alphaproteobacteria bacterium]|nr:DEAD/DEAH box helicase [Alphaproteobacteria bacterium]